MIDFVNVTNKELLNYLLDQKIIFNKHFDNDLVEEIEKDENMVARLEELQDVLPESHVYCFECELYINKMIKIYDIQ